MLFFKKKPDPVCRLKGFLQRASSFIISFDRLTPGVDNIRYDVHLSPKLCALVSKLAFQGIALAAHAQDQVDVGSMSERATLRHEFRLACRDVLFSGIRLAKDFEEIQIDLLAQIALYKFLIQETRDQFDNLCRHFKKSIREAESHRTFNPIQCVRLKQSLSDLVKNRQPLLRAACKDLFQSVGEAQRDPLRRQREAAFGTEALLSEDFFDNPLVYGESPPEDSFMISEYLLFGHRHEDANRYDALVVLMKRLLSECDAVAEEDSVERPEDRDRLLNEWIGEPENMDRLFNAEETSRRCVELKALKDPSGELPSLRSRTAQQKRLLGFFYRRFKKTNLIPIISASFEIQPDFQEYCPPLTPQAVLQFVVNPRSRKTALDRLKRLSKTEKRVYSADGLWKMVRRVQRLGRREKEAHLLRYLKNLSRYHRDLKAASRTREAMDAIHLVADEKTLKLSRINNLLYEFLMPEEETGEHFPIINHVVLKADVRGSTEIIHRMKSKGLNPASFFSLNFFDPINRLLEAYEAEKVFIEGDAIILSIPERARPAKSLFTVARACCLAMDILSVVQRYNAGSRKAELPLIELGIGIGFQNGPPTYLFDGDRRIMISPAINEAHLLCRSDKWLVSAGTPKPRFSLVVFEAGRAGEGKGGDMDAPPPIYNVNGIALGATGFRRLAQEVDLKVMESTISDFGPHRLRLHAGKFPIPSGATRTLVIREAPYSRVHIQGPSADSAFDHTYYEVCTYPAILAWAEKRLP